MDWCAQNNPTLYTPPEFFEVGQLGRHSDIYPVGLMLREMLAGNFSYENYTTTYIVEQLAKSRSPIRQADLVLPIWLPKDLCRIIRKAEHRSRFERYPTATAMDEALSRATFADWSAIDETAWEVTTPGRPDVRLKVEARELSGGAIRLSVRRLHTGWRRIFADQDVPALDSREARTVFDKATSIVAAR